MGFLCWVPVVGTAALWNYPAPSRGSPLPSSPILTRTQISWVNSSPDGRAVLRDFVGNLLPQRLLKQKLQSLTHIASSKAFQSHGERGHGGPWWHCPR